jgi:arabinose-5-phosphate isomerase
VEREGEEGRGDNVVERAEGGGDSAAAPVYPKPMPQRDADFLAEEREFAASVLRAEAEAISSTATTLNGTFHRAVDLLEVCVEAGGTVLVTGLGKSGLIGGKISATLASLGIPSHAVHPSEAAHGDLGRFRACDTVIALSFSGETEEVVNLAAVLKQDGLPIIAITRGRAGVGGGSGEDGDDEPAGRSSLERLATVTLPLMIDGEAGGLDFAAPTCSTTATLAIGDALALAVARRRQFTDADFAKRHPGGSLGGLLRSVTECLRFVVGKNLPLIHSSVPVREALECAAETGRRPGAILLVDDAGRLAGIFTDGDLRRLILRDASELGRPIAQVMTKNPRTLPHTARMRDAVRMIRECRQDEIPVVDDEGRPVGILDVQDLVAMKLVRD